MSKPSSSSQRCSLKKGSRIPKISGVSPTKALPLSPSRGPPTSVTNRFVPTRCAACRSTRTEQRTSRKTANSSKTAGRRARPGKSPEERAAEVKALAEQLNDAVAELTSTEAWLGMFHVAARFTRYSPSNVLLLWMQAEQRGVSLSWVAGYCNTVRPHEALSWNRPHDVHVGPADPRVPNFPEPEILPLLDAGHRNP